jgi:pimeloyl-ACP methyl ester carboxylesterase
VRRISTRSNFSRITKPGRFANPTAHGANASDAFHVVIPSMPGYGFSDTPATTGWGPERVGRAWAELMKRLGYTRYVAQGGNWSAFVVDQMGLPPSLRMDSLTQT